MREVTLQFSSSDDLAAALREVAESGVLSHLQADLPSGLVQVVFKHLDATLGLFAQVKAPAFHFTDERTDLRFQVEGFAQKVGLVLDARDVDSTNDETSADESSSDSDSVEESDGEEPSGEDISEAELESIRKASRSSDPIVEELKRIKSLAVPQKLKLAEEGNFTQRNLLFRMYGKLVFDSLLKNPRITEPEVAKLAKLGTLPPPLFQVICMRPDWLRSERIRNNLLANPRTPVGIMQRVVSKLSKQELRPLLRRHDLPPAAQAAIKAQSAKLIG